MSLLATSASVEKSETDNRVSETDIVCFMGFRKYHGWVVSHGGLFLWVSENIKVG
jgi:hypothetical protein